MKKTTFLLSAILAANCTELFSQNLIFKSGFEPSVQITTPIVQGNQWTQYLTGQDQGFDWSTDLPLLPSGTAQWKYLVIDTATLSDYIEVKIDTVTGPLNNTTNALLMNIKDWSPSHFGGQISGKVRTEYRMEWDTTRTQAYIKYWIKLQPDLYTVMPLGSDRWRYLMEWRESSISNPDKGDYRWNFQIRTSPNPSQPMYWSLTGEEILDSGNFIPDWSAYDTSMAVPIGQWFKLEVYWKQANDATGRVWIAVNDTVIIDRWGDNMKDSGWDTWQPFKIYTSDECMDDGYNYQWIDDVEIWDSIPQTTGIQDYSTDEFSVSAFPNPTSSEITISIQDNSGNNYEIKIMDMYGKIIKKETFSGKNYQLDTRVYSYGIYFYQVTEKETGKTANGKLVFQ